jgi:uncharacterized protein YjbI with pentapeptide repeats
MRFANRPYNRAITVANSMNPFESQDEYENQSFAGITLEAHQIRAKTFYHCTFAHCRFRETEFRKCQFSDCTFQECDLSLVTVEGSSFRNTEFKKSKLIGVNWSVASWSKFVLQSPLTFYECVIDYSTFIGLALHNISFKGCMAREVEFAEADLSGADFSHAVLTRSRFRNTNLTGANFKDAADYTIDVTLNKVSKATFSLPEAIALLRSLDIKLEESF